MDKKKKEFPSFLRNMESITVIRCASEVSPYKHWRQSCQNIALRSGLPSWDDLDTVSDSGCPTHSKVAGHWCEGTGCSSSLPLDENDTKVKVTVEVYQQRGPLLRYVPTVYWDNYLQQNIQIAIQLNLSVAFKKDPYRVELILTVRFA